MNWIGPLLGLFTLLIIGAGFWWVIRGEYRLGWQWWPYFMAGGLLLMGLSLFVRPFLVSALLGITGASLVWGSTEMPEQAERAEKGWYPRYPGRKPRPPLSDHIERWPRPHL